MNPRLTEIILGNSGLRFLQIWGRLSRGSKSGKLSKSLKKKIFSRTSNGNVIVFDMKHPCEINLKKLVQIKCSIYKKNLYRVQYKLQTGKMFKKRFFLRTSFRNAVVNFLGHCNMWIQVCLN